MIKNSALEQFIINEVIPPKELAKTNDIFKSVTTKEEWLEKVANFLGLEYIFSINDFSKNYVVELNGLNKSQQKVVNQYKIVPCLKIKDQKRTLQEKEKIFLGISDLSTLKVEIFDFYDYILVGSEIAKAYLPESGLLDKKYNEKEVREYLNKIFAHAINKGASDVSFTGKANEYVIEFEVSGKLEEVDRRPIDFMKIAIKIMRFDSGLNVDSILPSLDGKFTFAYGASITSWRFAMMQLNGVDLYRITLRVPTLSNSTVKIDELNYYPRVEELIRETMGSEKGLILFSGPTGSGKTTILYATLIERVTSRNETFITLEHPVENEFEELQQCNITENFPYQDAIRSALRANPTGLLIGEIRDTETARAAVDAALTGHATYSTLHLGSYRMLISRLEGLGIQLDELASVLAGIFIQRKAAKLCDSCKIYDEETGYYKANLEASIKTTKLNHETNIEEEIYTPCPKCSKSKNKGYHSIVPYNQVAIFKDNITTVNDEAIEVFINFKECLKYHLSIGNIDKREYDKSVKKVGGELTIAGSDEMDETVAKYVLKFKENKQIDKKRGGTNE